MGRIRFLNPRTSTPKLVPVRSLNPVRDHHVGIYEPRVVSSSVCYLGVIYKRLKLVKDIFRVILCSRTLCQGENDKEEGLRGPYSSRPPSPVCPDDEFSLLPCLRFSLDLNLEGRGTSIALRIPRLTLLPISFVQSL